MLDPQENFDLRITPEAQPRSQLPLQLPQSTPKDPAPEFEFPFQDTASKSDLMMHTQGDEMSLIQHLIQILDIILFQTLLLTTCKIISI